ncbi:hypothetical protein GGR56DRAFT_657851 [Xylariaceae sp. FL0804]|nr:hypothetical protein GGR56DRAFT_657851 [Xylariaceae sp. FL0804]
MLVLLGLILAAAAAAAAQRPQLDGDGPGSVGFAVDDGVVIAAAAAAVAAAAAAAPRGLGSSRALVRRASGSLLRHIFRRSCALGDALGGGGGLGLDLARRFAAAPPQVGRSVGSLVGRSCFCDRVR